MPSDIFDKLGHLIDPLGVSDVNNDDEYDILELEDLLDDDENVKTLEDYDGDFDDEDDDYYFDEDDEDDDDDYFDEDDDDDDDDDDGELVFDDDGDREFDDWDYGDEDWRLSCTEGPIYDIDPYRYRTKKKYARALRAARDEERRRAASTDDPDSTSVSDRPHRTINREDYPHQRAYEAADFLNSAEEYPELYDAGRHSKQIERCNFILNNPDLTAAKYLSHEYGFLFALAVKQRFKLPISIPDDDGNNTHTSFNNLFFKVARHNTELAIRIWHWVLATFSPYIQYDRDNASDICLVYDLDEEQLIAIAHYGEAHPHFVRVLVNTLQYVSCTMKELIYTCIENGAKNTAKMLFAGFLANKNIDYDEKENIVSRILNNDYCYDAMKFIRDVLLPIIPKYADKPMKRKISQWQTDIAEYIKENFRFEEEPTNWRDDCAYMLKWGIDPCSFATEEECREAYRKARQAERQEYDARRQAELDSRAEICKKLENGESLPQYIYCAVILSPTSHPYHYLTTDDSIKIGDKVIVPIKATNEETIGTVASVSIHTELTVPFPVNRTKRIIRKA